MPSATTASGVSLSQQSAGSTLRYTTRWRSFSASRSTFCSGDSVRDTVEAYASGLYWREIDAPGPYIEEALGYEAAGFRAIKMKVGREPCADASLVNAVRGELRDSTELMIDANHAFDAAGAVALGRAVDGIGWFEEPVPPGDIRGYQRVRQGQPIPVSGGEVLATLEAFAMLINGACVDVVQPDTCLAGGFTAVQRIRALALAAGTRYVPHVWGTAIARTAAVHLLTSMPAHPGGLRQLPSRLECDMTEHPFREEVATSCPRITGGTLVVPEIPGLGVEVDEQLVRRLSARGL